MDKIKETQKESPSLEGLDEVRSVESKHVDDDRPARCYAAPSAHHDGLGRKWR